MVGNDIIDIVETKRSTNWKRTGFIQKLFTGIEQDLIEDSIDPFRLVWRLWSMKESAYKVVVQSGAERFFNPLRCECTIIDFINGRVDVDDLQLQTTTSINSKYIYTSAGTQSNNIDHGIFLLNEIDSNQQSVYMQEKVLKAIAKKNALNIHDLLLRKSTNGVPVLFFKDQAFKIALSITHHGNYGAYSIAE